MEIIILALVAVAGVYVYNTKKSKTWNAPEEEFPPKWKTILAKKVPYYNALNGEEKKLFGYKIQEFLLNYQVTGIGVTIDIEDKLLVAASRFNVDFETTGPDRRVLGMVGTGVMSGKMILSRKALHHGFDVDNDKRNTAIHEFIHLIDKIDGSIDGIPKILLERRYKSIWWDKQN